MKYATNMHKICTKYAPDMHLICTLYAEICIMLKYAFYMHKIRTKYATNMHEICNQYAPDMHLICTWYDAHICKTNMQEYARICRNMHRGAYIAYLVYIYAPPTAAALCGWGFNVTVVTVRGRVMLRRGRDVGVARFLIAVHSLISASVSLRLAAGSLGLGPRRAPSLSGQALGARRIRPAGRFHQQIRG